MGIVRSIINFLGRFNKQKREAASVTVIKKISISMSTKKDIETAIRTMFGNGEPFSAKELEYITEGYSSSTVRRGLVALTRDGIIVSSGDRYHRKYSLVVPAVVEAREPKTPTQKCTKCGEDKPYSSFPKNKTKKDGIGSWCKACHSNTQSLRRAEKRAKKTGLKYTVDKFGNVVELNKAVK